MNVSAGYSKCLLGLGNLIGPFMAIYQLEHLALTLKPIEAENQ
jgi:hypothetical protein